MIALDAFRRPCDGSGNFTDVTDHAISNRLKTSTFAPAPTPLEHASIAMKALPAALERMRGAIAQNTPADEALMVARCRWLAKKVVRAGFELVAPLERAYTRDLYPCWQGFARHHRALTTPMEEVLLLAIRPTARTSSLRKILELGEQVLIEARRSGRLL